MQALMQHTIEDIAASREDLIAAQPQCANKPGHRLPGGAMLLGMAFYVSRRASVRIADLLKWSQRIADGDLANHLVSDAGDEVGQLTMRCATWSTTSRADEANWSRPEKTPKRPPKSCASMQRLPQQRRGHADLGSLQSNRRRERHLYRANRVQPR